MLVRQVRMPFIPRQRATLMAHALQCLSVLNSPANGLLPAPCLCPTVAGGDMRAYPLKKIHFACATTLVLRIRNQTCGRQRQLQGIADWPWLTDPLASPATRSILMLSHQLETDLSVEQGGSAL